MSCWLSKEEQEMIAEEIKEFLSVDSLPELGEKKDWFAVL